MSSVTIRELETDTDYIGYQGLTVLGKLLWEELEQKGKERFLGSYYANIGFYTKTWRYVEIRYLLAFLEYLNPEFQYAGAVTVGKTIVTDEKAFQTIMKGDSELLERLMQITPYAFLKYGMLIDVSRLAKK